jgi:hypothetical protein
MQKILPDVSFLAQWRDKIEAVVITHGWGGGPGRGAAGRGPAEPLGGWLGGQRGAARGGGQRERGSGAAAAAGGAEALSLCSPPLSPPPTPPTPTPWPGHEDHIGALPWVIPALDPSVPVYGGGFVLQLVARRLQEFNLYNPERWVSMVAGG